MTDTPTARPRSFFRRGWLWLAGLVLACFIAAIVGLASARSLGSDLAYRVGYFLPIAALMGGALHALFRRKVTVATSWVAFFLIYATLVGASSLGVRRDKAQARQLAGELRETLEAATGPSGSAPQGPLVVAPQGDSDMDRAVAIAKTMVNRMAAQRRDYETELDRLGWASVLEPQRLARDTDLSQSRALVRSAHAVVEKYRAQTPQLIEQARQDIETRSASPAARDEMMRGFNRAIEVSLPRAQELWRLELRAVDQFDTILDLLATRKGAWGVEQGQIAFQQQADLDRFRALLAEVQKISAQQEQLQKAQLDQARASLDKLGR